MSLSEPKNLSYRLQKGVKGRQSKGFDIEEGVTRWVIEIEAGEAERNADGVCWRTDDGGTGTDTLGDGECGDTTGAVREIQL
jgi:hypothetical protein